MRADKLIKTEIGENMNSVNIVGTVVCKPELKVSKETKYTRFPIAVNSYTKGEKKTAFFDVVAFGKNAENICNYLDKGYTIPITGHLHQDVYTSKEGKKVSSVCVYLDSFTFVSNKKDTDNKSADNNSDDFEPFN